MSQSNRTTFAPTIEQLREMFEDRIWISISPEDIKNAEGKLDTYSSNRSRQQGLINYLCQQKLTPIIQEYSDREPKLYLPQDSDDRMASLWDVLNGFSLIVDGYKLVIIPSECSDLDEFSIPKEWMDIPELRGDYYLAVQVDLEEGWFSIWGYATHQEIKNGSEYSPISLNYSLDEGDVTTDVNLIWTAIDLGIKEVVNLNPIPDLSPVLATELIEQLSKPSLFDIRHDLEFEQWAGIIKDARWQTQLYKARTRSLRPSQKEGIENISNWFYGILSPIYKLATGSRSQDSNSQQNLSLVEQSENLQLAILELRRTGWGDISEVDLLDRIIYDKATDDQTRWMAADRLCSIDSNYPSAGVRTEKEISFNGQEIILKIGAISISENKSSVKIRLEVDRRNTFLPKELKLLIINSQGNIHKEIVARENDSSLDYKIRGKKGEEFAISVRIGDIAIVDKFRF